LALINKTKKGKGKGFPRKAVVTKRDTNMARRKT
jgi:hypothetical protein